MKFFASSFAFVALVFVMPARAQVPMPDIALAIIDECSTSELDIDELRERLRVELLSDGVRELRLVAADAPELSSEHPALAILRIAHAPCAEDSAVFSVRIDDLLTRKRIERTFDLGPTNPRARARALALSTAELLRASWAELAIAEPAVEVPEATLDSIAMRVRVRGLREAEALTPPTTPHLAVEPEAEPSARSERSASTAISAMFVTRAFVSAAIAPMGGRASLDLAPLPSFVIRIDVEAAAGTSFDDPLGTIELGLATFGLTLAYSVAIGSEVLLSIGPRAAAGAAWAAGSARDPMTIMNSGAAPIATAGAALELDIHLFDVFSARFGVDVQATLLSFEARVASIPVTGIAGASIGLWAGLAVAP